MVISTGRTRSTWIATATLLIGLTGLPGCGDTTDPAAGKITKPTTQPGEAANATGDAGKPRVDKKGQQLRSIKERPGQAPQ